MRFGVVILAAGASRRMGRPKLLLPWGGGLVIDHLVSQWRRLGADRIGVVYSSANEALVARLGRIDGMRLVWIENPDPSRGMFSSIQCAARYENWGSDLTHWALTLGDQPHVREDSLRALLRFAERNSDVICQPSRGERPRHPVVIPRTPFEALRYADVPNLKVFLQRRDSQRRLIPIEDVGLDLDIDTPADYEAALRLAFGESPPSEKCGD